MDKLWNPKERRNLAKGSCENAKFGIIYEYDLGVSPSTIPAKIMDYLPGHL